MSNPFKAIGKVFKSVVKVVKKVALPALMIGAVVLTGGAALGVLPAVGSVLGSIGISGTLASVLGGAITAGATGALLGGATSALSGGSFWKGATSGFLGGAVTGGLLGGLGVVGPNGIFGSMGHGAAAAGQAAATGAINVNSAATASAVNGWLGSSTGLAATGAAAPVATGAGAMSAGATGAASGGGGFLGNLFGSGQGFQLLGGLLNGFSAGKEKQAELKAQQQAIRDQYDRIAFNYGYQNVYGDKKSNVPTDVKQWFNYDQPQFKQPTSAYTGQTNSLLGQAAYSSGLVPTTYDIINGQVVAQPARAGG